MNILKVTILTFLLLAIQASADNTPSEPAQSFDQEIAAAEMHIAEHIKAYQYDSAIEDYRQLAIKYPSDLKIRNSFRKLIKLKDIIDKLNTAETGELELSKEKKLQFAEIIRNYLYSKGIYENALEYDSFLYELAPTPKTAEYILESYSILNMNTEARKFMSDLNESSLRITTLSLLFNLRNSEISTEQAHQIIDQMNIDPIENPMCMFDIARIYCLTNQNSQEWVTPLIYSLRYANEANPNTIISMTMNASELQSIKDTEVFAQILKTPSRNETTQCAIDNDCIKCSKKEN